jgi:hypothetical protein
MKAGETQTLRELAYKCRCLARGVSTPAVAETLSEMARDYDRKADKAAVMPPAEQALGRAQ